MPFRAVFTGLMVCLLGGCSGSAGPADAMPPSTDGALAMDADTSLPRPEDAAPPPAPDSAVPDANVEDAEPPEYCGDGILQEARGEECDDGNLEDEDECSNGCRRRYPCARFPVSCDDASPTTAEHQMRSLDPCFFGLVPESEGDIERRQRLTRQLTARLGPALGVGDILTDLNRSGRSGVTNQTATRLRRHSWRGFSWNSGDSSVDYWYPQGITGTSDATDTGLLDGRRVMITSWYHRTDARPTKGARISIADTADLTSVRYRHLLLVQPHTDAAGAQFRAVESASGDALHAGGIVWFDRYLYVVDTTGGLRLFDLENILRVSHSDDTGAIGIRGDRSDAHGYRYIVPEVRRYLPAEGSCPIRFSFLGLDRSTSPPSLTSGEYQTPGVNGRLVSWYLDPATGELDVRDGEVRPYAAVITGQSRMQGALTWDGTYYISSSSQYLRWGRLYRNQPGRESDYSAWVYGCEDLYYERDHGIVWTPAEFPDFRDVVGIPLPSL